MHLANLCAAGGPVHYSSLGGSEAFANLSTFDLFNPRCSPSPPPPPPPRPTVSPTTVIEAVQEGTGRTWKLARSGEEFRSVKIKDMDLNTLELESFWNVLKRSLNLSIAPEKDIMNKDMGALITMLERAMEEAFDDNVTTSSSSSSSSQRRSSLFAFSPTRRLSTFGGKKERDGFSSERNEQTALGRRNSLSPFRKHGRRHTLSKGHQRTSPVQLLSTTSKKDRIFASPSQAPPTPPTQSANDGPPQSVSPPLSSISESHSNWKKSSGGESSSGGEGNGEWQREKVRSAGTWKKGASGEAEAVVREVTSPRMSPRGRSKTSSSCEKGESRDAISSPHTPSSSSSSPTRQLRKSEGTKSLSKDGFADLKRKHIQSQNLANSSLRRENASSPTLGEKEGSLRDKSPTAWRVTIPTSLSANEIVGLQETDLKD